MKRIGALIVPTGVGADIGGYAGDASRVAQKFSRYFDLIVNPNVVNAACFSGITENMLYVEGYSLDEFFKGHLSLIKSKTNKIGVVFDKTMSKEVLNIHINTINAVKMIYGIDVVGYEITEDFVGVEFNIDNSKTSSGSVKNIQTVIDAGRILLEKGADTLAVVCSFEDSEDVDYENGNGVDPVGGVEAVISHCVSQALFVPVAHSPAFEDCSISTKIVDAKVAAEFITPTFLPCVLLGLSQAPLLSKRMDTGLVVEDLQFLIMPYDSLGSIPVFECLKRGIKVFAIKENSTVLNIDKSKLSSLNDVIVMNTYDECLEYLRINL